MRLAIKPTDRVHMLVWRQHPSAEGNPGWRVALAINGCPVEFASRYYTGEQALAAALAETSSTAPRHTGPLALGNHVSTVLPCAKRHL